MLGTFSWALSFLGNFTQTGVNRTFVGDYFQMWINTRLSASEFFTAAGKCLWD